MRTLAHPAEVTPGATTTLVRADSRPERPGDLHPQLKAQLRELQLRSGKATPDVAMLLNLINAHYQTMEGERRGIAESMRLMADEARALALEAREQSSEQLQVILDHIKDVVLALDEQGVICTFNPTGERVFGFDQAEAVGRRIDALLPALTEAGESVPEALQRLAAALGDTALDLAARELWARRKDGTQFQAEIAVSRAPMSGREMFVLCLRDITERRQSEQAVRESEARYRLLVDHAPDAIVVLDVATGRFADANDKAQKLFGLGREQLLEVGPVDLSPARQPDGAPSAERAQSYITRCLQGEPQIFEWAHCNSAGREIMCEVRLVGLPSGGRQLVRGSIADISERKRGERLAASEREVFEQMTRNASLPHVLASVIRLVESVGVGTLAAVSVLDETGRAFAYMIAPELPAGLRTALERASIEIRNGSCAAAVYLGRQVLVADIRTDAFWAEPRAAALGCGLHAAWSTPIKAAGGKVLGSLGLYRADPGLPSPAESQIMARAAQLAGIAIERRLAEEALRSSEAKFRAEKERAQVTLQSIGDAVISTDAAGCIEYINPVAERLTAWSLAEARGRPIGAVLRLVNELTREPIENSLAGALGAGEVGATTDHSVLITRAGHEVAIQESAAPIRDREGRVIGAVVVFHDVTRERRLKRALAYQASHDALTGLINRREFDNRLHGALGSAQRGEGTHALLYIDLDQFKVVNDTCGHQAGDRLLRDLTGLLQTRVRTSDTIARLGGDEFGVLLEGCTLEQASRIAEAIRQAIRDFRFVWGASTLSVGASIGIVQIRAATENVAALMSAADIACYAAKDAGRNRLHVYDADGVSNRHREMQWVARVTRAAEDNRLELFFQPIVPLAPGHERPFHELTVRLREDDGSLVPPSEFIPAAERYNVMSVIDRWVVARAVELLRQRLQRGEPLPLLAVNLSGTSLNEQSFVDFVLQSLGEPAVAAALCFEITETAAVTTLPNARYLMSELKARGCKFSLDDFGTGMSSFVYLKTLPVDYLKIDGQFVNHIAQDAVSRSMVEAIARVGRALGIATVAECVESQPVLDELKRIGVDFAQGFHLARPLPLSQLPL